VKCGREKEGARKVERTKRKTLKRNTNRAKWGGPGAIGNLKATREKKVSRTNSKIGGEKKRGEKTAGAKTRGICIRACVISCQKRRGGVVTTGWGIKAEGEKERNIKEKTKPGTIGGRASWSGGHQGGQAVGKIKKENLPEKKIIRKRGSYSVARDLNSGAKKR